LSQCRGFGRGLMSVTIAVILGILGLDAIIYWGLRAILGDHRAAVAREVAHLRGERTLNQR
jgi:hypothetical protein